MENIQEEEITSRNEQDGLRKKQAVQKSQSDASPDQASLGELCSSAPIETKSSVQNTTPKKKKKKARRCQFCNVKLKKKARSFMACRCGGLFCNTHRLACDHECTYKPSQPQTASGNAKFDRLTERMD